MNKFVSFLILFGAILGVNSNPSTRIIGSTGVSSDNLNPGMMNLFKCFEKHNINLTSSTDQSCGRCQLLNVQSVLIELLCKDTNGRNETVNELLRCIAFVVIDIVNSTYSINPCLAEFLTCLLLFIDKVDYQLLVACEGNDEYFTVTEFILQFLSTGELKLDDLLKNVIKNFPNLDCLKTLGKCLNIDLYNIDVSELLSKFTWSLGNLGWGFGGLGGFGGVFGGRG